MRRSLAAAGCLLAWLGSGCSGAARTPAPAVRPRDVSVASPARSGEAPRQPEPSSEDTAVGPPLPAEPDWISNSTWEEPYAVAMLGEDCRWAPPKQLEGGAIHVLHCMEGDWGGTPDDPCVDKVVDGCGAACTTTCHRCPTACISRCETCKSSCQDAACRRQCGRTCATCRKGCIDEQHSCNDACRAGWAACLEQERDAWDRGPCPKLCTRFAACVESCTPTLPGDRWECNDVCRKRLGCLWAPTRCGTF